MRLRLGGLAIVTLALTANQAEAQQTGQLLVVTEPAGAMVFVDGEPQGTAPLTIPDVTVGEHRIVARASGLEARARVQVQAGLQTAVSLVVEDQPAPDLQPSPPSEPEQRLSSGRTAYAACSEQDADACYQLATSLNEQERFFDARLAARRACTLGHGSGCELFTQLERTLEQRRQHIDQQHRDEANQQPTFFPVGLTMGAALTVRLWDSQQELRVGGDFLLGPVGLTLGLGVLLWQQPQEDAFFNFRVGLRLYPFSWPGRDRAELSWFNPYVGADFLGAPGLNDAFAFAPTFGTEVVLECWVTLRAEAAVPIDHAEVRPSVGLSLIVAPRSTIGRGRHRCSGLLATYSPADDEALPRARVAAQQAAWRQMQGRLSP